MTRYARLALAILVLLLLVQCAGFSRVVGDVKYSQPMMGNGSYDFSSELKVTTDPALAFESKMADDWICPDGRPITDIHWWGSYWARGGAYWPYSDWRGVAGPPQTGGITGFTIRIYGDDGSSSHAPGALLWTKWFDASATGETKVATITKTNGTLEDVYYYSVDILDSRDWFAQTQGQRYWLSIQAKMANTTVQWGWHESDGGFGDNALQMIGEDDWGLACSGHDLAFELTSVPEPGSLTVLGLGLVSMGGLVFRRRRS